ncbi:MAG: hypothetical protein WD043_12075 [Gemmatimonadales bacterium]
MSKMIQIRHVPEAIHRTLKARAAQQGKSLSAYLLDGVRRMAEEPTWDEITARIRSRPPMVVAERPADIIRRERDSR